MSFTGGDVLEITYNHPTLGSGSFQPKAAEEGTYHLGGMRNNDDANSVSSSGSNIRIMNNTRWFFEQTIAVDQNLAETQEKLAALAQSPVDATWTITHINGTVYRGNGAPVGEIDANVGNATLTLKVAGGGTLQKIQ